LVTIYQSTRQLLNRTDKKMMLIQKVGSCLSTDKASHLRTLEPSASPPSDYKVF